MNFSLLQIPAIEQGFHQVFTDNGLYYHSEALREVLCLSLQKIVFGANPGDLMFSRGSAFNTGEELGRVVMGIVLVFAKQGVDMNSPKRLIWCTDRVARLAHRWGYHDVRERSSVWESWKRIQTEPNWQEKYFPGLWAEIRKCNKAA